MAHSGIGWGFRVGHWTDPEGRTGCTVVLPPRGNVASCDVRGSSPGSRELEQLDPRRRLTEVHAVLLTGGSAFGLAAAQGVMEWLEERGIGYETPVAKVPIVPAAVVFDLRSAEGTVRPGPAEGRAACDAATEEVETGAVGAGAAATVGKWAGPEYSVPGGLGLGVAESPGGRAAAVAVVNPVGDVLNEDGSVLTGTTAPDAHYEAPPRVDLKVPVNTVLALVAVQANLDKRDVHWLAERGSDGITKTIRPAHTRYDGDVTFAIAAPDPSGEATDLDVLGPLTTAAVAEAVRAAVRRD
jgi:L-aminopeptidase/D-esterase-like protein